MYSDDNLHNYIFADDKHDILRSNKGLKEQWVMKENICVTYVDVVHFAYKYFS